MQSLWIVPIASAGIGAVFFVVYLARRVKPYLLLSAAWLAFAALETGIESRLLCDEECNIRLELVTLAPALLIWSVVAVAANGMGRPGGVHGRGDSETGEHDRSP